ncbi:MAG: hypothetical protein L6R36_008053 [Xanthoria steineri]|nr:MAG: hypothetical protein L6R36_008053 [Xanthoria steineri]
MSLLHRSLRSLTTKPPIPQSFPTNTYQQHSLHTLQSIPYTSGLKSIPPYASTAYSLWPSHTRCMGSSVRARAATWASRTTTSPWQQTRGMKVRSSVKKMCDGCKAERNPSPSPSAQDTDGKKAP